MKDCCALVAVVVYFIFLLSLLRARTCVPCQIIRKSTIKNNLKSRSGQVTKFLCHLFLVEHQTNCCYAENFSGRLWPEIEAI